MIFDQLKNSEIYFTINEKFKKAFDYLKSVDFTNTEPGKYEIEGEDIYAIVQQYDTKPLTSAKWEAHKKYIDIQYIVSGKEKMGYSHKNKMIVTQEYNDEKDVLYLKGEGNFLTAETGYFAIFFPSDVHMPGIALNLSTPVKKVVVKVKTDLIESEPHQEPAEDLSTEKIAEEQNKSEEQTETTESSTEEANS